ncbi:MAG: peptidoglycan DD-metalloendopeptidase family protein [Actinomycetaceae bacterium]|nr:peptidoglycan DD-metalloendopeptidase family protein [Actinomycetaceae bacterium]
MTSNDKTIKIGVASIVLIAIFLPILLIGGTGTGTAGARSGGLSDSVPAEYRQAIIEASTKCDLLTPGRLAAQLFAESGWNPNAVSHAGAQGLAQFMPGTWQTNGQDGDGDGTADPFNPIDAIFSMAHYMCSLSEIMQQWISTASISGDLYDLTLAAYNAGAGAVQSAGGVPAYEETRAYIQRIRQLESQFTTAITFAGTFRPPIDTPMTVTSPFGFRIHPIYGTSLLHAGVDIASPMGQTQVATAAGKVTHADWLGGCGNTVIIDHGTIDNDHYETWHCHLSAFTVVEGQTVNAGDPIGVTGTTGNSTGPHVHYQINRNDQPIDPWPYINP